MADAGEAALPRYALYENERRWLVRVDELPELAAYPSCRIEDWYLDNSHLRLRRVSGIGPEPTWKLCKKYGSPEGLRQPIVNLYLDETEYETLRRLPGCGLAKTRYTLAAAPPDEFFAVDLFEDALAGLAIVEFEAASLEAVRAYTPPIWTTEEITGSMKWSGAALARNGAPA